MDFSTLLQQAQKLTTETQAKEETLNVERTLPQVLQATQVRKKNKIFYRCGNYKNFYCDFIFNRNSTIESQKLKIFKMYKLTYC